MEKQRLNRFGYEPITDADGVIKVIDEDDLEANDDKRFRVLAPYDYLTADYISALAGLKSPDATTNRFYKLKRAPGRWINIAAPQLEKPKRYLNDFLAYSLSDRSRARVVKHHWDTPYYGFSGPFVHRLQSQWERASFEIAVNVEKVDAEIIPFHVIMSHPNTPEAVRKERGYRQHHMEVKIQYEGESLDRRVIPDSFPFAIRNAKGHALIFRETDCDSKPIKTKLGHDVDTQLLQYLAVFRDRVHWHRYGFRDAYLVFTTTNREHLRNVIAHLVKITEKERHLRRHFLFAYHPSYESEDRPSATGHMLTNPYLRAGLPDFSLLTGEDVPNGHREITGPDRKTRSRGRGDTRSGQRREEGDQATRVQ